MKEHLIQEELRDGEIKFTATQKRDFYLLIIHFIYK